MDGFVQVAVETVNMQKQAIVFCSSKRSAQKSAIDIAKKIPKNPTLELLSKQILDAVSAPTDQCRKLASSIHHGIAFHHAGLAPKQRSLVEDGFRDGRIKIIASTPTLAAGLDMPAFRTILKDLKRYSPPWGMQYIPVLEYEQMAGRAGRPGKETYGQAIAIAKTQKEKDKLKETYIDGEVEDIHSKLAVEPVLRMYVLSLLSTRVCETYKELVEFFSQSFWAAQYQDVAEIERIIGKVLQLLTEYNFLEKKEEFETASDLLEKKIIVTLLGERVSELYIDPYSANIVVSAIKEKYTEFGFIQLLCTTLEIRPLLRVKSKEAEEYNEVVFQNEEKLLTKVPSFYDVAYEDFFETIKTTNYFIDWIEEKGEQFLFEKYDIRPGEISVKNEIMDWLLYCASELCQVLHKKDFINPIAKLRVRIKNGVKAELLPLLQLKQIGRARARNLFDNGITSISDLKRDDESKISKILGPSIAKNVFSQIGRDNSVKSQQISQQTLF